MSVSGLLWIVQTKTIIIMKNLTKTVALAAFALAVVGVVRAEDGVAGKWKAEFDSQVGKQKYTFEFKVQGANVTGILSATLAGIGLAAVPDYVAAERPQLIRVLPDVPGPCFDVHLVYADALRQAKRVAAFRDFLVRSAKDWRY